MKNTKRPVVPAINIKTARRFTHGGVHVYHVPHTNHTNRGAIVLFAEYYGAVRCGAVRVLAFENRAVRCVTYGVWFLYFHTVESDAVSRLNGMVRNDAVRKIRVTTPHTERRAVATCFVLLAPYLLNRPFRESPTMRFSADIKLQESHLEVLLYVFYD